MRILNILLLSVILALSACSPNAPKASTEVRSTNADLEQAVRARLEANAQVAANRIEVSADVDKNQVTLTGIVPDEQLRTQAVDIAKASRPGLQVVDKLQVKPPEIARVDYTEEMARGARENAKALGDKIGDSLDDAWLYSKIVAKLIGNPSTPARKINVDVLNGVVTLRGVVDSPVAREEADRIARDTDGVKRVKNLLAVHGG
jgi:hyperosmotically inducible protein